MKVSKLRGFWMSRIEMTCYNQRLGGNMWRKDIFMVKVSEEFHFSEGTETEHGMIKRGNLFNRNFLSARFMQCRPTKKSQHQKSGGRLRNDTISALAYDINDLIVLRDIKLNLAMTSRRHSLTLSTSTRCCRRGRGREGFFDEGDCDGGCSSLVET